MYITVLVCELFGCSIISGAQLSTVCSHCRFCFLFGVRFSCCLFFSFIFVYCFQFVSFGTTSIVVLFLFCSHCCDNEVENEVFTHQKKKKKNRWLTLMRIGQLFIKWVFFVNEDFLVSLFVLLLLGRKVLIIRCKSCAYYLEFSMRWKYVIYLNTDIPTNII